MVKIMSLRRISVLSPQGERTLKTLVSFQDDLGQPRSRIIPGAVYDYEEAARAVA